MIKRFDKIFIAVLLVASLAYCHHVVDFAQKMGTAKEDKKQPDNIFQYEILTDNGECWVVDRSKNGLVKESIYHGGKLYDCINFLRELHYGE
jgi:hypothetical protein